MRPECDPELNQTVSPYIPGTYSPQADCTTTVLGVYLSGGEGFNTSSCVRNTTDPYTAIIRNPAYRRMAQDWLWSNDVYPTVGSEGPPYRIPEMSDTQLQVCMFLSFGSSFIFPSFHPCFLRAHMHQCTYANKQKYPHPTTTHPHESAALSHTILSVRSTFSHDPLTLHNFQYMSRTTSRAKPSFSLPE